MSAWPEGWSLLYEYNFVFEFIASNAKLGANKSFVLYSLILNSEFPLFIYWRSTTSVSIFSE